MSVLADPRTTPARRAGAAAVLVFAVTASLFLSAPASQAAEYPSWEQVQSARASEASTQTQITELTGLLERLEADVAAAQREQQQRGEAYERAQGAYDRANHRAATLQEQADAATVRADASQVQAGRLAASLSRTAGSNLTLSLLTGKDSSSLLNQLATMSKLAEKTDTIYATATADANTARSLTEQADIAKAELGELASASQNALADAIAASDAVQQRRDEQAVNAATLQAQLSVLTEDREATEADYQRGEDARRAAETAAAAQAAQAAAARAAQAAATAVRTAPAPVSGGNAPVSRPAAPAAGGPAPVPSGSGGGEAGIRVDQFRVRAAPEPACRRSRILPLRHRPRGRLRSTHLRRVRRDRRLLRPAGLLRQLGAPGSRERHPDRLRPQQHQPRLGRAERHRGAEHRPRRLHRCILRLPPPLRDPRQRRPRRPRTVHERPRSDPWLSTRTTRAVSSWRSAPR